MRLLYTVTGGAVLIAVALWAVFVLEMFALANEREAHATALANSKEILMRDESQARLKATVRDTAPEREALNKLFAPNLLAVVEAIEKTGTQAGAQSVRLGEATPHSAPPGSLTDIQTVAIVVTLEGSFSALVRAMSLYETLAIPATLEQFEMEKTATATVWRATARLKVIHSTAQ
jgi:hypothetical protein